MCNAYILESDERHVKVRAALEFILPRPDSKNCIPVAYASYTLGMYTGISGFIRIGGYPFHHNSSLHRSIADSGRAAALSIFRNTTHLTPHYSPCPLARCCGDRWLR